MVEWWAEKKVRVIMVGAGPRVLNNKPDSGSKRDARGVPSSEHQTLALASEQQNLRRLSIEAWMASRRV